MGGVGVGGRSRSCCGGHLRIIIGILQRLGSSYGAKSDLIGVGDTRNVVSWRVGLREGVLGLFQKPGSLLGAKMWPLDFEPCSMVPPMLHAFKLWLY